MCDKKESRTLSKNKIKNFILRVDLIKKDGLEISKIAEKMSQHFERTEKRQVNNFTINFTKGESELSNIKAYDYVLISELKHLSITFSETHNAFWLECNQYRNNGVYKDIISKVIEVINHCIEGVEAKRIGMRFINEYDCKSIKDISKIYGKRLSTILKTILNDSRQIRVIGLEEYNNEGHKLRLQYGIPNKYYPAVLTLYDLIFDIDSYSTSSVNIFKEFFMALEI